MNRQKSLINVNLMLKRIILTIFLVSFSLGFCLAQDKNTTASLMYRNEDGIHQLGKLNIYQDPRLDTLINRYILYNMRSGSLEGYRIQIYNSSDRNAKVESGKMEAEFIARFPGIKSYATFERPGYYKIRVGDYRTRTEGTKDLLMIRKLWPDAYMVPDKINFPDLN